LNRIADQTGGIVDIEFCHEIVFVSVDRLGADVEMNRDFLDGKSFSDQFQDFAFAQTQPVVTALVGTGVLNVLVHVSGHTGIQVLMSLRHHLDGINKLS